MQWQLRSDEVPSSLEELKTILFRNRAVSDPEAFVTPPHPLNLTLEDVGLDRSQVESAIQRLLKAKAAGEKILIFGDYDADGISATAVMWQTLDYLGIPAQPFIPHREQHGYGLSHRALDEILAQQKPSVVITVDNGIVAHEPAARLKELGVDIILTDHHQPETKTSDSTQYEYPPALAVVHTTQLCGTTVAWMFAKEAAPEFVENLLDLAGIATIADQVPLVKANRSFAFWGLKALQQTQRVGLQKLAQVCGIELTEVTTNGVNFGLVPRINAMGRLSHGLDALRLLCTKSQARAAELVSTLHLTNLKRQDLTDSLLNSALQQASSWENEHIIISVSPDYHEGVIGLIAGRLMEQYYKPAIVISVGEKAAKASARSIAGVNIVELIRQVRDELLEVGGHPMAAGFGLLPEKVESVTARLQELARQQIHKDQLVPSVLVECELPFTLVTSELVEFLGTLAPFGQGNSEPIFGLRQLEVVEAKTIGKDSKHLKLLLKAKNTSLTIEALSWNKGQQKANFSAGSQVDVAGILEFNGWNGKRRLQIKVKDVVKT